MHIKEISAESFAPYGWVIEYPRKEVDSKGENLFRVVLKEDGSVGWRIAYLIVRDKIIKRLEQHPCSYETFEPVAGQSVLYVAVDKFQKGIEGFLLNRPIILKKGIWHGIVTIGDEAEIKITENAEVESIFWPVDIKLKV